MAMSVIIDFMIFCPLTVSFVFGLFQDVRGGIAAAFVARKTNYDPSFCAQLIQLRIGFRPVTKNNSLVFTMSGMTRCAASENQHGTRDNCQ